jgi:hypothetical protein
MRNRLPISCYIIIFGICNSLSAHGFNTLVYGLHLPCSLVTHTWTVTAFLLTNASLALEVAKTPLYRCSMRWILTKPFSEGPVNTGELICFRVLNHARSSLGRLHFWKLRCLAVKIGNMELSDSPLIPVICGYALYYILEKKFFFFNSFISNQNYWDSIS